MSDTDPRPVLARIIAAHQGAGPGQAQMVPGLQSGLTRAIRRAAQPFAGLTPEVGEVTVTRDAGLQDGVDALPDHGLLAAIEDGEGRRGLIAMDHPLVDALIEVQATGRVEDVDLPPRVVTRIDEALCRDFLDLMFGAFAKETADQVGRDWPDRLTYGSQISDRAQLNLLLPDRGYHLLKASVTAGGRKTGDLVMLLPVDAAIARRHAAASATATGEPANWGVQMLSALRPAPMALDAVLLRITMPLGQVEALVEGELVPFDRADLGAVTLEGEGGYILARGGLGQLGGRRAVRLSAPSSPSAASVAGISNAGQAGPAPNAPNTRQPSQPGPNPAPNPAPMAPAPLPQGGANPGAAPVASGNLPDLATGGIDPGTPMATPETGDPSGLPTGDHPDMPMAEHTRNVPMR